MSHHNHSHESDGRGKKRSTEELWKRLPQLTGEERIEALDILGNSSFEREDYASAAIFAEETAREWLSQNSKVNAAMAYLNGAISWQRAGYLDSSLGVIDSAQTLLDEIVIPDGTGDVREILGDRLLDLGEYSRAKTQFEQAIKIFEVSEDWHRCAHILRALSTAEACLGENASSFSSIDTALNYVVAKDFRSCCIGLVLQWVDSSVAAGLFEPLQQTLREVIESASAFGDAFGIRHLKLRLAVVANIEGDYEEALEILDELENEQDPVVDRSFISEQLVQKALSLSGLCRNEEVKDVIGKARSLAKADNNQNLLIEIDTFEVFHLLDSKEFVDAEKLINRLQHSTWYQMHDAPVNNLQLLRAHLLYRQDKHEGCLRQLDELLQLELQQDQLLQALALRAQIVLESNNLNLARVLIGKSKEIAESSNDEFSRMLFSYWYQLLEEEDQAMMMDSSKELVDVLINEDVETLNKKSLDLLLEKIGGGRA
jgi:tetratricopeptide (TPR) repeat protein